jgi:hypothetical protein
VRNNFILIALFFLSSCSFLEKQGFNYKTYKHPSIQFSIDYPSPGKWKKVVSWAARSYSYPTKKLVYFNPMLTSSFPGQIFETWKLLSRLSIQQLKLILNQYELITQTQTKLGNLNAFELRGRYTAKEGNRIIRTVVAIDNGYEFVLTFTAEADKENNYTQIINHMIESFHYDSKNR